MRATTVAGQMDSGDVGRTTKEGAEGPSGQGSRAGVAKDQPGGWRTYVRATEGECHRPQEQMLLSGAPQTARAAAPMRRRLCHVKGDQGVPASKDWKACWRESLEGAKGPPAEVAVTGARAASRLAQAPDQALRGEHTQAREDFSSKNETVLDEMSEGRMLAASRTQKRWAKARKAKQVARDSAGDRDRSARTSSKSEVAQS